MQSWGLADRGSAAMIVDWERVTSEENFGGFGRNHEIALRKTTDGEFSILAMLRTLPGGRRRSKWLRHGRECGRGF